MNDGARPMKRCSDTELQAMVTRYERAVFAGTSSHRDVVRLIAAEREILYRESKRVRRTMREERRARTASGVEGWLSLESSEPGAGREPN